MAKSCEEYSDGCSVDSYEDFESPSPSSSSEESAGMKMNRMQAPFWVRQVKKRGRTIASLDRRGK